MHKSNIKKFFSIISISLIIALSVHILFQYVLGIQTQYVFDRIFVYTIIVGIIMLHLVIDIEELYNFIINHRYKIAISIVTFFTILQYSGSSNGIIVNCILEEEKDNTILGEPLGIRSDEYGLETLLAISQKNNNFSYFNEDIRGTATDVFSIVHAPVKSILSIGKLYNIGYFIFDSGMGLAFYWNIRMALIFLISYELAFIITKNKYMSLGGSITIVFSSAVQWLFSNALIEIIIFGELALVLLDKFMISKSFKIRLLCLIGISISVISYVFTFYPAFMIVFGYVFLSLAIWIIMKNKKEYKVSLKDIISIIICVIFVISMFITYYSFSSETINKMINTAYPGNRGETGGNGIKYLFSYLLSTFLTTMKFTDNCNLANFISLFPIPLILSLYYIKRKQHIRFLLPITIITLIEVIFVVFGFPAIISKISLFKYTIVERVSVAIGIANVYILLYLVANIEDKILTKPRKNCMLLIICICSIVGGITVNPITKGTYVIENTDIAKKIQEIVVQDEDALWISTNNKIILANFAMANGAKVINSTNIYPNDELFKLVLGDEGAEKQENIWNRYAHISIIIDDKNYVRITSKDMIELHITVEKMKELNIEYVITHQDEEKMQDLGVTYDIIYQNKVDEYKEFNYEKFNCIYIYKLNY